MEVSGDDDIPKFYINRGRMVVYHALTPRTTAGIRCSAPNCLQQTALTTARWQRWIYGRPVLSLEGAVGRIWVDGG